MDRWVVTQGAPVDATRMPNATFGQPKLTTPAPQIASEPARISADFFKTQQPKGKAKVKGPAAEGVAHKIIFFQDDSIMFLVFFQAFW